MAKVKEEVATPPTPPNVRQKTENPVYINVSIKPPQVNTKGAKDNVRKSILREAAARASSSKL